MEIRIRRAQAELVPRDGESRPSAGLIALSRIQHRRTGDHGQRALARQTSGVLAADLKLDSFSEFVQSQRPGAHGSVLIFDSTGALIAHPNFAQFVVDAMTHPSQAQLPTIKEINSGVVQEALRRSDGRDHYEGSI